jgi:hypothetical protein
VNIAATLPGWTKFEAAQNWLDRQRVAAGQPARPTAVAGGRAEVLSDMGQAQKAGLYQEFLRWRQQRQEPGQRPNP